MTVLRLSISNIAWDPDLDEDVAKLLSSFCIDAIDIAPSKYFPDLSNVESKKIARIKQWWLDKGVAIVGMQGLLFGMPEPTIFESDVATSKLLHRLSQVCRVGSELGATKLVFGSPKNRQYTHLTEDSATERAIRFFSQVSEIAGRAGVVICLEPIPTHFGCNFMNTVAQTAPIVRAVGSHSLRMQLDTGAIVSNHESIDDVLRCHGDLVGHIHISEPFLSPIGTREVDHRCFGAAIRQNLPSFPVTIEMLVPEKDNVLLAIRRAFVVADEAYRSSKEPPK